MNSERSAPILRRALEAIGDRALPAPGFEALTTTVVSPDTRSRRTRPAWIVAAALTASVGLVAVGVWAFSARDGDTVATTPTIASTAPSTAPSPTVEPTTSMAAVEWPWPALFGTETAAPPVPDGWKVLDFEDFRFAVPADWSVPISPECATDSPGLVMVSTATPSTSTCSPVIASPTSVLTIQPAQAASTSGGPQGVGTLTATATRDPECAECSPTFRFANGYEVTVSGPDRDRVLATFTDSGARRALQIGEEADTSGWQPVEFEGVSVLVPSQWTVVDLPATFKRTTDASGNVQESGWSNPGACGGGMFTNFGDHAFTGTALMFPSCPAWVEFELEPFDGLWVRTSINSHADRMGVPIATGQVDGLDFTVVHVDRMSSRDPSPVLDLLVSTGSDSIWITLGVGLDSSIARSVLESLHSS